MKVVALAGGVGGAKLAEGLAQVILPTDLSIVVNTGDDFDHLGLRICPDLDTVCYTLAGLANPVTGWGRKGETWSALETVAQLGGPNWFRLGDHDIGLHLERTRRLREGEFLCHITQQFCQAFGIKPLILPMSDDNVSTWVYTDEGELPFQEYFVHRQCHPRVKGFRFEGVENSLPAPGVIGAIEQSDLVVICPSNPWVSIGPILEVPGIQEEMNRRNVLAISPIIGGQAVKGPAAKMYSELGIHPSAEAVARHYGDLISGFILDHIDQAQDASIRELGIQTFVTDTMMNNAQDRSRLAKSLIYLPFIKYYVLP
jgi:LPPG:FO 2-phospho-L-lactate transferase